MGLNIWWGGQWPGTLAVLCALEDIEHKPQRSSISLLSLKRPTFKEMSTLLRHSHWGVKIGTSGDLSFPLLSFLDRGSLQASIGLLKQARKIWYPQEVWHEC